MKALKKILTKKYFLLIIFTTVLVSVVFIVFSIIYSNWEEQSKIQKRYDSFCDRRRESLDVSTVNFDRLEEVKENLEPILQEKLKTEYKEGYEDTVENWSDIKSFYITFDNGFYCHVLHSNKNRSVNYRVFCGTENYDTNRIYEYVCGEREWLNYRFYLNENDDLEVVVEQ